MIMKFPGRLLSHSKEGFGNGTNHYQLSLYILLVHQNYNYEELGLEIGNIYVHEDESLDGFYARFM